MSSAYLAQPGSPMATRRSSRNISANFSKTLFSNSCFICGRHAFSKTKRSQRSKKILTLLTEATKAAAKDRMCEIRTPVSSLMSFFVTTLAINHLLSTTSVVFEKLLQ